MKKTMRIIIYITCLLWTALGSAQSVVVRNSTVNGNSKRNTTKAQQSNSNKSFNHTPVTNWSTVCTGNIEFDNPYKVEIPNFGGSTITNQSHTVTLKQISVRDKINDWDNNKWMSKNNFTSNNINYLRGSEPPSIIPRRIGWFEIRESLHYPNCNIYVYWDNKGTGGNWITQHFTLLLITSPDNKNFLHLLDFTNFTNSGKSLPGEEDFTKQSVNYALVENDILYISHGHRTYAKYSYNENAYISAIDLKTYGIIWTSKPLTCNSNFIIADNSIICGYGFTDEPDYIYVLDKLSGSKTQTIKVANGPEIIMQKGSHICVATYSKEYEFSVAK